LLGEDGDEDSVVEVVGIDRPRPNGDVLLLRFVLSGVTPVGGTAVVAPSVARIAVLRLVSFMLLVRVLTTEGELGCV
jgi:hypothetical protein